MSLHILGIRHHGPGSARSILNALNEIQPDCILVEGPPDANDCITQLKSTAFEPPVALLLNTPIQKDDKPQAAFYPFAEFSPEWQALKFALQQEIHVEFMDLPCLHRFAIERQWREELEQEIADEMVLAEQPESFEQGFEEEIVADDLDADDLDTEYGQHQDEEKDQQLAQYLMIRQDPIKLLAEQAGYQDSERFWEHLVEQQPHAGQMFKSIQYAMNEVRAYVEAQFPQQHQPDQAQLLEQYREASMRKIIRQAQKQGFANIVVICGAWHAPKLAELKSTAKNDTAILKGLPKIKVDTAWIAWTHGRLNRASGYGAGVQAVGWYAHLWSHYQHALDGDIDGEKLTIDWLSKFAQALRQAGYDASSAQIIDAVQLIQALLQLRGRRIPDLDDLFEVIQSVLHHGLELPLPVMNKLLVDEKLGKVPDEVVVLPIQQDFLKQIKHFRLKLEAPHKEITLDLREQFDLSKSQFLHRLKLLGVAWAELQDSHRSQGNFKEIWQLSWQPESNLYLNEMSIWGNTIVIATKYYIEDKIKQVDDVADIAKLIEHILLSGLDSSLHLALTKLDDLAAQHQNPEVILDTLKPLAIAIRYGNVRKIAIEHLSEVVEHLSIRLMLGLPNYCLQLNEEMAKVFGAKLQMLYQLLQQLEQQDLLDLWDESLHKLLHQEQMQGYLHGFCVRLAREQHLIDVEQVHTYLARALSSGQTADYSAGWFEGFLTDQALLLIHEQSLWLLVNQWVQNLTEEQFIELLPILARTASSFAPAEAKQMIQKIATPQLQKEHGPQDLDLARGKLVLDHLYLYLKPTVAIAE